MDSEAIEQPSFEDGVGAWAKFAGQLRQKIGSLRRELLELREGHVALREKHAELERRHERMRRAKKNESQLLNRIERDLSEGDIVTAVDRLAERRSRIDAAASRIA